MAPAFCQRNDVINMNLEFERVITGHCCQELLLQECCLIINLVNLLILLLGKINGAGFNAHLPHSLAFSFYAPPVLALPVCFSALSVSL